MSHNCHAVNCETPVPPNMLMCRPHWYMVPSHLRRKVWLHYRAGQESDKSPSASWCEAVDNAITAVSLKERHDPGE